MRSDRPQAFLLAAGLGTRARPLTDFRPKVLFPVAGVAALHLHLASIRAAGIPEIGINLHHLAEDVERALASLADRGLRVAAFREERLLGTGGGLLHARPFLGRSPLLVRNADVVLGEDLRVLLRAHEAHRRRGGLATLLLSATAPLEVFGGFAVNPDGSVLAHVRRDSAPPPGTRAYVYASAAVVEPRLLDRLESAGPAPDLVRDGLLPALRDGEALRAVLTSRLFGHIGRPEDYLATVVGVLLGGLPPRILRDARALAGAGSARVLPPSGRWIAPDSRVHPTARLGHFVAIESRARVPRGAILHRAVVWEGVRLREGERLEGAVACDNARVGAAGA
ncbi:MAG TPA: NDP-sugar synthase [Planctomycetota bacterium]|nr:NDP-sugar synthase [Planctomycetota bacterium]